MHDRVIFLLSVPRSGSTLLQRILGAHHEIETVSEPWLLLPLAYMLKKRGCFAEYEHHTMTVALEDLIRELPRGREDFLEELRTFVLRIYAKSSGGKSAYFLDKTPKYYLIIDEIAEIFPDAKFVFLWRNPLAIVASIMRTFQGGKWNLYQAKADLFSGIENLAKAYRRLDGRAIGVRFEDLIDKPAPTVEKLHRYLELDYEPETLQAFVDVTLRGKIGDPTGMKSYQTLNREPLNKWSTTLSNPIRKAWCRRYLNWIGSDNLRMMGYDLETLLDALEALPTSLRYVFSDSVRIGYGVIYSIFEPRILYSKIQNYRSWQHLHAHR